MSAWTTRYGHAGAVARLLEGYHRADMPEPDDTSSFALKQLQAQRADGERHAAQEAEQPAEARAHERRAEKAAYLRDRLAEAEQADRDHDA
jgi:uncharacterized membrane protein YqiK